MAIRVREELMFTGRDLSWPPVAGRSLISMVYVPGRIWDPDQIFVDVLVG